MMEFCVFFRNLVVIFSSKNLERFKLFYAYIHALMKTRKWREANIVFALIVYIEGTTTVYVPE